MQKWVSVICVLLGWMALSLPLLAATTRVSCHDPDGIGGEAGEWYALYSVGAKQQVEFHELGFRPYADGNISHAIAADAPWQISVRPLAPTGLETQQSTTRELLGKAKPERFRQMDLYPQLLTPNGHCTLFLRSYDYLAASDPVPSGPRVAIVGDSLMQAFTSAQETRHALALEFAQHNWHMEVSAIGGLAWQLISGTQPGANLRDEIRGLLTTHPDIFVFELGTNDALLIAKTRIAKTDMTTEEARRFTVAQIAQTLTEVDAYAPAMCKILMTPSTHPYFLYTQYIDEAVFVGDVLRFFAGQPTRTDISAYVKGLHPVNNARIADWATVSAGERMAAHMPDGIHLVDEAAVEFRALWMREIAGCEKQSADL